MTCSRSAAGATPGDVSHRALGEGDDAKVADLLGQSYYLEGAFDDAERCWRQSILLDPDALRHVVAAWQARTSARAGPRRRSSHCVARSHSSRTAIGPLYTLSLAYRGVGQTAESDRIEEEINHLRGKATTSPQGNVEEGTPRDD